VSHLATHLFEICADLEGREQRGQVSSAIPALAEVSDRRFAIAVVTTDGGDLAAGDAETPFSIQSISKIFTLALALGRIGDHLWDRVGREPSGSPFNSIVQLEYERGIPRNPFINAGALVTTDIVLCGAQPREAIGQILQFVRSLAGGDRIYVDANIACSEAEHSDRNRALAHYLKAFGNLGNSVDHVLGVYHHQCAIAMTCRELARAGLFLAGGGRLPSSAASIISPKRARRVNALMMTCGLYDGSGDFAFRVGLPGKSGIGGAILAIVPGRASVAVWSPGLNRQGNSELGILALERLAQRMNWNIFADARSADGP
jgi:glutaminase